MTRGRRRPFVEKYLVRASVAVPVVVAAGFAIARFTRLGITPPSGGPPLARLRLIARPVRGALGEMASAAATQAATPHEE
jgi:hypothetical protein